MASITPTPFPFFEEFEKTKTGEPRKRSLRFDLNALADFEQAVGMGFAQLMEMKAAFATVRAMVWAGLKHQDRALTIERAGTLIGEYVREGGNINDVLTACIEAAVEHGALGRPQTPEPAKEIAPGPAATDAPATT
jgi:hypothetical protein